MKKLTEICQEFKKYERISQSELVDLYYRFLVGELSEEDMLLQMSTLLVNYGYKYREISDLRQSFFGKMQYKFHKFKEEQKMMKVSYTDDEYVRQKDYFDEAVTKRNLNEIYELRTSRQIVEDAIKEVLLSCKYVEKYLPLEKENIEVLTNRMYSLLDFSYLNIQEIISYLTVNIVYENKQIDIVYKETVLNIVENYLNENSNSRSKY